MVAEGNMDLSAADPNGERAFRREIEESSVSRPLMGANAAAEFVYPHLLQSLTTERGIHLEEVATQLGALAGYACQSAALDGIATHRREYAQLSLLQATTSDGTHYFYGDALNRPLAESPYSVYSLVAGMASELGFSYPDRDELFRHCSETLGTPEFGIPRYADGTFADSTPREVLQSWPRWIALVQSLAPSPQQWPIAFAFMVQKLYEDVHRQDAAADLFALTRVVMDAAIAMSKVTDLAPVQAD
jgi:hypothetical protein